MKEKKMDIQEEYETFIQNDEMCDFEQSLAWNKIKTYWTNEQIIIKRDKDIKLAINVLIRKMPIFGNIMYVPRGPIGDIHSEELLEELTTKLKELAKKVKAFVVLMEPDIRVDDEEFKAIAKKLGYKIKSNSKSFRDEIQARHNLRLNLKNRTEEEVFESFASKTRYNIRLSMKKGVEIKELGKDGIEEFYELLKITGNRDGFIIRPIEYYKDLFNYFDGLTILIAYYESTPIAGIMPLTYGNKTWYLYGASSNIHRNVMSTYLLQWEAIKIAMKNNSILYDFKGFSFKDGKPDGLYRFKSGFGTELVELIGEVNLEIKPLKYRLFKTSKKLYTTLRGLKHTHKVKKEEQKEKTLQQEEK